MNAWGVTVHGLALDPEGSSNTPSCFMLTWKPGQALVLLGK